MRRILVLLALSIRCLAQETTTGKQKDASQNEAIEAIFAAGYNRNVRPRGTNSSAEDGGPVIVHVNFFLRRLADVDEDDNEYDVELTFRQQWQDERLVYDKQHVDHDPDRPYVAYRHATEASEKIWTPDTFFQNSIDIRDYHLMEPNELVRIYPDGNVIFSKRISVTLAQSLELGDFPFDMHDLYMDIASYGHDDTDVIYQWRNENPVQVRDNSVQDHNFQLIKVYTKRCTSQVMVMGRFSCLRAEFQVQRRASRTQLFEFFGPSFVLVIVSWLPFMLSTHSLLARALIGLSALITIILQIALIDDEIPETHDTTWAHVWLFTCFAFIVAAQLQLVAYTWLSRIRANRGSARRRSEQQRAAAASVASGRAGVAEGHVNEHSAPLLLHTKGETTEEQLALLGFETIFDLGCLLAFALGFFVFNCYFWTSSAVSIDDDEHDGSVVYDYHKMH